MSSSAERRKTRAVGGTTPPYLIWFVKLVFITMILLWLAPLVESIHRRRNKRRRRNTPQKTMQAQRRECEETCLKKWIPEEAMGCVLECRSPTCFAQVYGEEVDTDEDKETVRTAPQLEPGEVDLERHRIFDECNLNEAINKRKEEQNEQIQRRRRQKEQQAEGDAQQT